MLLPRYLPGLFPFAFFVFLFCTFFFLVVWLYRKTWWRHSQIFLNRVGGIVGIDDDARWALLLIPYDFRVPSLLMDSLTSIQSLYTNMLTSAVFIAVHVHLPPRGERAARKWRTGKRNLTKSTRNRFTKPSQATQARQALDSVSHCDRESSELPRLLQRRSTVILDGRITTKISVATAH